MKIRIVLLFIASLAISQNGHSQGFVNLGFENATIVNDPSGPYAPYSFYASDAIPGWTAYIDGISQTDIGYNGVYLSNAGASIEGTNGDVTPISGLYSVLLQGAYNPNPNNPTYTDSASIGQTGLVPSTARSLTFLANISTGGPYLDNLQVSFDGQLLSFSADGSTADATIYEADISAFAGQTGQLLFDTPYNGFAEIDNIQFSPTPVPEPGTLALVALGASLLGFRRWRNSLR